MDSVILIPLALLSGFLLLTIGGEKLVTGSASISSRLGIRPIIVGLTVVAWATSAPELCASGIAAANGSPGISLGNVLGSNIANIGLVLGTSAAILPAILDNGMRRREAGWLLLSLGVFWWAMHDLGITRFEGGVLLGTFAAYNLHLVLTAKSGSGAPTEMTSKSPVKSLLIGSVMIAAGAQLIVWGAQRGAVIMDISDRVVGLTLVAVGTSLPELAAGVVSARKGESQIGLGNVVGSNVFNSLVVLGVVAFIVPLDAPSEELRSQFLAARDVDLPIAMAYSIAAVLLPFVWPGRFGRWKAVALLGAYLVYSIYLFMG